MRTKLRWSREEEDDLLRQLDVALEASGIGIWQHNIVRNQTRWDEQLQRLYGVSKKENEVIWLDCVHPDDCARASSIFQNAIQHREDYAAQFRILLPSGQTRHIRSRAKYFINKNGEPCFIGAEWDVTEDVERTQQIAKQSEIAEQKRLEAKYAADHDYLTGVYNRRALDEALENYRDTGVDLSFCHLDIDNFTEINAHFGHEGGDFLLRQVASILQEQAVEGEYVARLGGDEFAVFSPDSKAERMLEVVRNLRQRLKSPLDFNGDKIVATVSSGVASAEGDQIALLRVSAELALRQSKRIGHDRDELFTPALAAKLQHEKLLLRELREAISVGEIVPYYQVQVSAHDKQICGLEALARWSGACGIRLPAEFMPLAQANGLMDDIDDAILKGVGADLESWGRRGINIPRVSVNVSGSRLSTAGFTEYVKSLRLPMQQISFELVETIFLDRIEDEIRRTINSLRRLGIEIEIDDLGSGHASLLGLVELRPDRVKIDRHLIAPVPYDPVQEQLVRSLVDIAKALKISVVAEGVETMVHAAALEKLGIDVFQGFAFGRPEDSTAIANRFLQDAATGSALLRVGA